LSTETLAGADAVQNILHATKRSVELVGVDAGVFKESTGSISR